MTAPAAPRRETAGDNRSLPGRIDLAIRPLHGREDQDSTLQVRSVADRGHCDVYAGTRLSERWQIGCHQDGSRVSYKNGGRRNLYAHPREQIRQALRRENRLPLVACAIEAHHQAVSHQLVVANTFNRDQVLETSSARRGRQ